MREALKAYLSLATSLTEVTRQRAVTAARALAAQGEATAEQVGGLAEDLLQQTRANREAVSALVRYEVDRALGRVGLASVDEVADLSARVQALETELRGVRSAQRAAAAARVGAGAGPAQEKAPAEKAPAKKAAAKKAPARKAAAKKAPAKKAAADKAPAEKAAADKAAPADGEAAEQAPVETVPAEARPADGPPRDQVAEPDSTPSVAEQTRGAVDDPQEPA